MSQQIAMPNPLTPAIVTSLKAAFAAINVILAPINVSITDTQKKGLVIPAAARQSEIAAIETGLMEPFPGTIPTTFTLADFLALDQEQIDSSTLEGLCVALVNFFSLHGEIVGNNRMLMAIQVMDNARIMGKSNPGIKAAEKLITTEHLTPGPKKGLTTYSIAASMTMDIAGLKSEKPIINNGTTILDVLEKNGSAADTITINPGDSENTPKGWINVTVTNRSATTVGSFQAYLKP